MYRDVRKLIYRKLDAFDRALVEQAHMSSRQVKLDAVFARECARRGHLRLQWARARGCPWDDWRGRWLPPGLASMVSREWMSLGELDMRKSRCLRAFGGAALGASERLSVGEVDLL